MTRSLFTAARPLILFWMTIVSISLVDGAIAPPSAKKPPPEMVVGPGEWTQIWAGVEYDMSLSDDGSYSAVRSGAADTPVIWSGTWSYDRPTRLLSIEETPNGGATWIRWSLTVSSVEDTVNTSGVRVRILRRTP